MGETERIPVRDDQLWSSIVNASMAWKLCPGTIFISIAWEIEANKLDWLVPVMIVIFCLDNLALSMAWTHLISSCTIMIFFKCIQMTLIYHWTAVVHQVPWKPLASQTLYLFPCAAHISQKGTYPYIDIYWFQSISLPSTISMQTRDKT